MVNNGEFLEAEGVLAVSGGELILNGVALKQVIAQLLGQSLDGDATIGLAHFTISAAPQPQQSEPQAQPQSEEQPSQG